MGQDVSYRKNERFCKVYAMRASSLSDLFPPDESPAVELEASGARGGI